ncbi:bifunctional 3-(3-hydroxy-phenyl)propionate/3-hydroxycinnamic acid hydroxylase [Pusillimonas sp.]|uniref:bifunctional 3-(3-hydroxy-phenyl)propionate/3-hydroxycinnamic acid hydroxylase n=1 Tax=Pusillimonas sp. TaxID=3040095 RepID=UPI0037C94B90
MSRNSASNQETNGVDHLYDVAIVGYGPAGATLANLLALRGLSVLVLEREADVFPLPRAIHFDGEVMRVFQTIGIADALEPSLVVAPGMRFLNAEGKILIDWKRPTDVGPQAWRPSYRFHQPDLEIMLRERLAQYDNAHVRLRHDVFAIEQHADHALLRVENLTNGRLLKLRARYVVGCDGARSLVRRLLDTELEDMKSHERWLVVDVLLKRDRPDLGDHSIQYCDPARPATYVRGAGQRRRWELMIMPDEDAAEMALPENIWKLLSRWITPKDGLLERPAVYTFHSVVAKGWRKGRMLIAGDAAHQTPPFMGQGLCAGIRDVANLGWKLAEVIRGRASEDLLDTYESERSPHVREFIEAAVRLGSIIQTRDPEVARRRDAEMANNPEMFTTPNPQLGPGAHNGDGVAGRIALQPFTPDGRRFDEVAGYQFSIIALPEAAKAAMTGAGGQYAVHVAHDERTRHWLVGLPAKAALIRPDRYIAAVGQTPDELKRLFCTEHIAFT